MAHRGIKHLKQSDTMRVHMVPGNYGFFRVHFLPIFWPRYSLFITINDINIDKNKI